MFVGLTSAYLSQLLTLNPGDCHSGEIELLRDSAELQTAQEQLQARLRVKGLPEAWGALGVVYQDQYVKVLRDAVRFRTGALGTYIRVTISDAQDEDGGVVLVVRRRGCTLLKRIFRHATRQWELELPRGFRAAGHSVQDAALAELVEETGHRPAAPPELVGRFFPDTGLMAHTLAIVEIQVDDRPAQMHAEVMESIRQEEVWMTMSEITKATRDGTIRDGITLAALAIYFAKAFGEPNVQGDNIR